MLRDTDELRDRMDRPENQERMAESRQQLEQTRENVRRASEALEQGHGLPGGRGRRAGGRRAEQPARRLPPADGRAVHRGDGPDARGCPPSSTRTSRTSRSGWSSSAATQQRNLRDTGERQQVAEGLRQQKKTWTSSWRRCAARSKRPRRASRCSRSSSTTPSARRRTSRSRSRRWTPARSCWSAASSMKPA